jgi:hypothetical protein
MHARLSTRKVGAELGGFGPDRRKDDAHTLIFEPSTPTNIHRMTKRRSDSSALGPT